MAAQARTGGAPRLTRAQAAHGLGADPARLEDALAGRARDAHDSRGARDAQDPRTGSGLREDQAAAALAALTDGRMVSVLSAPAGSGKTRVLGEAARDCRPAASSARCPYLPARGHLARLSDASAGSAPGRT